MSESPEVTSALIVHGADASGASRPFVVGLAQNRDELQITIRAGQDADPVFLEPSDAAQLIVNLRRAIAAQYHYSWPRSRTTDPRRRAGQLAQPQA